MKFNKVLCILPLLFFVKISFAQNANDVSANKVYESNPVWIKMMDDSTANYFETLDAYNTYWSKHEKPEDEEGEIMNGEKKVDWSKFFFWRKKREAREHQERNWLRYQCKRFEWWKKENLPYVQPDGRILTMQERIRIFNSTQNK